jgi:hypothetical protein
MTLGYQHIGNRDAWVFDCPEGTWTARLDQMAWGKSQNLILYFTDEATSERYWFSVFHRNGYKPRDNGHDFKRDAQPGDLFELTTKKTKGGNPDLKSARKLSPVPEAPTVESSTPEEP